MTFTVLVLPQRSVHIEEGDQIDPMELIEEQQIVLRHVECAGGNVSFSVSEPSTMFGPPPLSVTLSCQLCGEVCNGHPWKHEFVAALRQILINRTEQRLESLTLQLGAVDE